VTKMGVTTAVRARETIDCSFSLCLFLCVPSSWIACVGVSVCLFDAEVPFRSSSFGERCSPTLQKKTEVVAISILQAIKTERERESKSLTQHVLVAQHLVFTKHPSKIDVYF
jgi:hypothetical protein